MSKYEEGLKIIEERFGNNKDNFIALATIATEPSPDGNPRPVVRDIDAYYEDGVFYAVTYAQSNKMRQIAQNKEVAFSANFDWFSGNGIGENLGWVLDPKNAELRTKLRTVFSEWYDFANNEKDENCCFLAIRITRGTVIQDHGAIRYNMDFVNKIETSEGKII